MREVVSSDPDGGVWVDTEDGPKRFLLHIDNRGYLRAKPYESPSIDQLIDGQLSTDDYLSATVDQS
jgi:archaellum component FlaG (FlaF/FlaG flagellin family)